MPRTPAQGLSGQFQESVDSAAEALKAAAASKYEISQEAGEALAAATTEIAKLAESLRTHAVDAAKDVARYAKHEAEAHPMASLAAALTAVVVVMGMVAFNWQSRHAAD